MSTKTNFKRIALVAVAALGLGLLSSVPSQAVIPTSFTLTKTSDGELESTTDTSDTYTAATASLTFLGVTTTTDSMLVTVAPKSKPAAATTYPDALLFVSDTSSSTAVPVLQYVLTSGGALQTARTSLGSATGTDSGVAVAISANASTANRYYTSTIKVFLDDADEVVAGTYTYTLIATPFATGYGEQSANVKSVDVSIVVAAATTTASAAKSSACLTEGATFTGVAGTTCVDSSVSVVSTAGATTRAIIRVTLRTSADASTANESVTVTTTRGNLGTAANTPIGKSVTLNYDPSVGYLDVRIFSDGTAGSATITVGTTSVSFAAKTVTFYSTTATKLTVINGAPTLKAGSNTMTALSVGTVWVKATDANGNTVVANADGDSGVWAYSATKTVVSDSGTACTYNSTTGYHHCSLTGVAAGTSVITIGNADLLEDATVKGDKTVTVTVNSSAAATLSLEFDKASYAPGERGFIYISAKDSAGNRLPGQSFSNLISSSGITVTKGSITGTGGSTLTLDGSSNTSPTTAVRVASIDTCDTLATGAAVRCITFMAPVGGGDIEISATGGAGLPAAGQVAVKASAKVTDNASAALAAVTALATTVASLKTLITTLTNLVLKIQKKVKA